MATLSKTLDISKLQKSITKQVKNISTGFNDPDTWISTGNYALNKKISNDFHKGIPLGKITMFAGESGCLPASAKVFVESGNTNKMVTVGELKTMFASGNTIRLATPDGPQFVTAWFDKGVLPMIKVSTKHFKTVCATNHLLETKDGWKQAGELTLDDEIFTLSGFQRVEMIENKEDEECYDFTIDHPNHRYWGDGISSHNSGKSFIVSGSIVKHAQSQGIFCVVIDTENALDEEWLKAVGVDTSPDKMIRIGAAMVDDVAKIISEFVTMYRSDYGDMPKEDRPKVLIVIDSLGMLLTPTDVNQFESGDMKGDMGRKAKSLKALVTNCTNMIGDLNIGMVMTNHTYKSQDMFSPDDVVQGGAGPIFAASIVAVMRKLKLKEDDDGNKTSDVKGIRASISVAKTRYAKPFEKIEVKIPYETGMNPYSGLLELCEACGVVTKDGNKLKYVSKDGTEYKEFRKNFGPNILDIIMNEWDDDVVQIQVDEEE